MPRTSPRPTQQTHQAKAVTDLGAKGLRTRSSILAEARQLMLTRGYDATTIGDIAEASGIRRASFYTYFASKEDVLMELGAEAEAEGMAAASRLQQLGPQSTIDDVAAWVEDYLSFWDAHGPFAYAAYQASYVHPELREWSLRSASVGAKALGDGLLGLRGRQLPGIDPAIQGWAVHAMLERFWYHWRVSGASVRDRSVPRSLAQLIWASAHPDDPE